MHAQREKETSPAPSRRTLGEEVAERLRHDILTGRLAPGALLRENTLAEEMKVSRGPVREALSLLASDGLVILPRNHSAYVARLTHADLEELHSLRMALAPLAARLAARNASHADLGAMQALIDRMAQGGPALSGQAMADIDIQFHDAVYRAANHRLLLQTWSHLRPLVHMLLLSHAVAQPHFAEMALANHQDLLRALRSKDEELAHVLATRHVEVAYADVKRNYGVPE